MHYPVQAEPGKPLSRLQPELGMKKRAAEIEPIAVLVVEAMPALHGDAHSGPTC